ncbi:MAG: hypothetical protein ACKVOW_03315 [Chitinophagaceae bacterium]
MAQTATKQQVLEYALNAKNNAAYTRYNPIQIRKDIGNNISLKKMLPFFDQGYAIIKKVNEAGNSLTPAMAVKYDEEMKQVMTQIDKLSSGLPTGNKIPECFRGCDDNYPGLGGGQGWKRFTCKMVCLIVEVSHNN